MNKIFKVVWSKSKECYVVVSEFAKNNSGKKKIVVAGIFAALAITNANVALAVNEVPTSTGGASVAFGDSATVTGANAVGLGNNASVTGVNAVGLGTNVKATLSDVVAIGTAAKVESASGGVAIGQNAYSKARYSNTPSVAVGKNSIANGGTAVALGTGATVNEAGASYSQGIAIGGGALPGQGAVVVGDQAIAIGGNTKALGHSSIVIGGDDADRMTSTKAVYTDITTGKPAVATVSAAVKALTGYEIKWRDYNNATADHIGITVGTKGQSGNAGIAIGTGADSKNRIAGSLTGVNTSAADNDSVTNAIAIGTGAKANRDNSVALGGGSTTDKPGTKQTSYTLPSGVVAAWKGGTDTLPGDIVSFGAEGFERQLKNVAPGEVSATSTDAINGSQLAAIADQLAYTWDLSANGEATPVTVKNGNKVDFSGDDNITVARNDKNISVSLKKDLTGLNSASFNNAAGNPTVKIDGDKGINAGDMKVTNVADGVADKDAVNVSQLKKTDDKAEANKTAIQKNTTALANKISLEGNTGSTTEKSLNDGAVSFKIKGEDGIATTAAGNDVTVKLDTATKNKIDNAANKDLSNLTPAGEQEVKDLAAWNVVANSETAEKVKGGDTIKFIDGDNVEITQAGKDFTISTKKDVTFDNVTANQAITAPKVKATTGVETPQVTGLTNKTWVPGQTQPVSGRAATEDQLKAVDDQVAANKDNITKNAGDIATNKADIAKNKDNIDKNTTAIARKISLGGNTGSTDEKSLSTGDVKFNVKGDNGLTTVANGDDVTVKLDDATKDKIDNAANKDLSNLTPAGEQQVKDLAAWNVVANGETAEKVQGGDTVKFINGDNIEITQAGKNFTIATKKDVTFDTVTANDTITAPKVKATTGVETPEVTGLTNKTWVPGQTQPVSGRAATEDQLKAVDDQVADNKDKIGKNADNIADNKKAIDKNAADIATNKDNIAANKDNITKNAGDIATNKADIAKNKDNIDKNTTAIARKISLGGDTGSTDEKSLSTGDVKFNVKGENGLTTVANGDDVTVKLDDATKDKIDNAANKDLSNLTPAGEQQVKDLAAWNVVANNGTAEKVQGGDTVKFINGDNIEITQNGKDFTVATKKDVTFDTVTANDTITAPKVKATDGVETPEVTGLTNKTWVPGQTQPVSGRAATEDQLKAVDDQVAANKDNITKNAGDIKTNKDNIAKNTEAIARKISLGGNTGSTDEKSLSTGDVKFNIKGENGLTTVANGEDVTVKIDDETKAKIDNAANQDLSNLTDAGKQQVKDLSAWNVTAAGGTVEKVQGGDTVKFQAGDNLEVKQDKTTFTYSLAKDLKGLNSVTVGDENGPSTKITPAGTTVKDAAGNSTTVNGAGMTITPANAAAKPVSLTVDGLNNGGNQIHGVAPGTADTDAVNVSQLKEAKAGLQQAINDVGAETQRVGAHAAAMAALKPIQYDPLEPTQIMAGIGNYRGETAGAIGLAHYRTEDTMFNVGITLGSSHSMVNAGVTHKFGGSRDRKDAVPERYKAGPISSIYVMQDEVSHLRNQNEEYKSKLEQQQSEIDALKAAVNQLLANKA